MYCAFYTIISVSLAGLKNMKNWYKIAAVILILYTIIFGMLGVVPRLAILNETIRNLYYHVPLWWAMMLQMGVSLFYSAKYLKGENKQDEKFAFNAALVGILLSIPGLMTGSLWARYTWGTWWTFQDPKLNGVAIGILIYVIYFILRASIIQETTRARVSSVFNIFAFVMFMLFIMVFPRLTDSLHPGNGGNPAFGKYDLDSNMRLIFYPAVIGWMCFSGWLLNILNRISLIKSKIDD
ncbi:MAG: cytochrome c biogenesis protein CcsA [Sphingobacteriaceae bacterium]|nr:cytochrome c biogenesis protein CcsA [Sphingobacteriaceae bacterium]MBK7816293.1 cytochrome c biogenesis protein CcsA [Sphingobacteriaceae bacterium]